MRTLNIDKFVLWQARTANGHMSRQCVSCILTLLEPQASVIENIDMKIAINEKNHVGQNRQMKIADCLNGRSQKRPMNYWALLKKTFTREIHPLSTTPSLHIPHIVSVIDSRYSCLVFCVSLCVLFNSECSRSIYVSWPIRLTVIAPIASWNIPEYIFLSPKSV